MKTLRYLASALLLMLAVNSVYAAIGDELGCISGNCENGTGTLVEKTDDGLIRYQGPFVNGKYQGFGKLELFDRKIVYEGRFVAGKKNGRGTQFTPEGEVYIGEWKNDKRNGRGLQAFYVEDWKNNPHSEIWLSTNAENYYGHFLNDNFDGEGTYRWADGMKFVGSWAANKKHGRGYFLYPNGVRSDREFNFDERVYGERPAL